LNYVEESIAIKAGSPKGIGTKALKVFTNLFELYRGQKLKFCIKHKAEDKNQPPTYAFEERIVDYMIGGIKYDNIPSLIAHTRAGMQPFRLVRSEGVYLAYPPLEHAESSKKFPDYSAHQIEPRKEAMEKLSEILKEVSSEDRQIRKKALEALKTFEKGQKDNH